MMGNYRERSTQRSPQGPLQSRTRGPQICQRDNEAERHGKDGGGGGEEGGRVTKRRRDERAFLQEEEESSCVRSDLTKARGASRLFSFLQREV